MIFYFITNANAAPLIVIQGMEVSLRVFIIVKVGMQWLTIVKSTIFLLSLELILISLVHERINSSLQIYLLTESLFLTLSVGLSYLTEYLKRDQFYSENVLKLEQKYLYDIIDNMEQGFFVLKVEYQVCK